MTRAKITEPWPPAELLLPSLEELERLSRGDQVENADQPVVLVQQQFDFAPSGFAMCDPRDAGDPAGLSRKAGEQ